MSYLIFYTIGTCIVIVVLVLACNFVVNSMIKQFTERALEHFQQRLAQHVAKALDAFKEGVCEQMAEQEKKSDTLAKLYAMLIDLLREGKQFSSSYCNKEMQVAEKHLLTFSETSRTFCEQYRKLSLHFSNEMKEVIDGFITEQEALCEVFRVHWNALNKNRMKHGEDSNEQMRQIWAKAEDRIVSIMNLMRNEFRKRVQSPESVMKKWLNEIPAAKTPSVSHVPIGSRIGPPKAKSAGKSTTAA